MCLVSLLSTISKFLPLSFRDQLMSLKNKFFLLSHNLSFVQVKTECKFRELCLLQRSAKVRSSALYVISGFLPPSKKVKKKCVSISFFKTRNESDVFCYIKSFARVQRQIFLFRFSLWVNYFIFNSNCNFCFSISMHSSASSLNFSCYNFSLSISFSLSCLSISFFFCPNNLSSRSNVSSLIL